MLVVRSVPPMPAPAHGQPPAIAADPARRRRGAAVDLGRRRDHRVAWPRRPRHRHSHGADAGRRRGTRRGDGARRADHGRHRPCAQPGCDDRERIDPDPCRAAADSPPRRRGRFLVARAAARLGVDAAIAGRRTTALFDLPNNGPRWANATARLIGRSRTHRACVSMPSTAGQARRRLSRRRPVDAAGRYPDQGDRGPRSSCTTCASTACCTVASSGRRMPAPITATSSATRSNTVDESSIAHIAGVRAVVVLRDFVGVVAEREEDRPKQAAAATARDMEAVARHLPRDRRHRGGVERQPFHRAHAGRRRRCRSPRSPAASRIARSHVRLAVSDARVDRTVVRGRALASRMQTLPHRLTVWAGTQNPHVLRADLAKPRRRRSVRRSK